MIAITGGIAEGKSTVLGYLTDLGYRTASADASAREVFQQPDTQVALATLFEREQPSRDFIREAISTKPELRRAMNHLMHGAIWDHLVAQTPDFVEIPLLVETCLHPRFSRVWVVTCGVEEQRRRLMERHSDGTLIDNLLSTQLSTLAKGQFADRIVRTNAERESVLGFVQSAAEFDVAR